MDFSWAIFADFGVIAFALFFATVIRARVPLLQRYLIPNALIAGFLLLPFYNWVAPVLNMPHEGIENLVFHLLNLTIIAMGLRASTAGRQRVTGAVLGTSTIIVSQLSFQALVGFLLTFLFIAVPFLPDLFPSYGFLVTLGYVLGPGQAFSIGTQWEAGGFVGAGGLGLIFGAIGFLFASIGGMTLINVGVRRGLWDGDLREIRRRAQHSGIFGEHEPHPPGMFMTTRTDAIDSLSLTLAAVFGVYLLTYLVLSALTAILTPLGDGPARLVSNMWSIAFIIGLLVALLVKRILALFGKGYVLENAALTRVSGAGVDFMVAAALGAISLELVRANIIPIAVFAVVVATITAGTIIWMSSRLFHGDHAFERTVLHWGSLTGTLSTGLALLRVIDPELKTPASSDYMYASGVTFFFTIPLILIMEFPVMAMAGDTPDEGRLWLTLLVICLYVATVIGAYTWLARPHGLRQLGRLWLRAERPDSR